MLKVSYAGCLGLSPAILAQFTLEMCAATGNRKKITKTPYFGSSRSFHVIDVDIPKKIVASDCYDKQSILCLSATIFMLNEAIAAKQRLFRWCHSFAPRSFGPLSPSGMKFCHEILETLGYHMVKNRRLYVTWSWKGTRMWRTDRQTELPEIICAI